MTSREQLPTGGENGADPLQRLFDRAQEDTFTPRQIEDLWSRLAVIVALPAPTPAPGAGAAPGSAGGGPVAAAPSGVGLKTVAALVVGGLLAAGAATQGWKLLERSAPTAIVTPAITSRAIAPAAPPVTPLVADVPGPVTPPLVNADSIPVMPASPATRPGAAVNVAPRPPAPSPSSPSQHTIASPSAPATAPPRDSSIPEVQAAAAERAPTEGALLLDARRAMATDPSGALALTDEHARRFPGGDLVLEREVLAIEALAALHRRPEARARLDALREKFPDSLHIARLERLLTP
jgi:hypothetical protein